MNVLTKYGVGAAITGRVPGAQITPERVEGVSYYADCLDVEPAANVWNTSTGAVNYMVQGEMREKVNALAGFVKEPVASSIYSLWNGTSFSQWLEVNASSRLWSGGVGPDLGYVTGTGVPVEPGVVENAVPNLAQVKKLLAGFDYKGEVTVRLAEGYGIVGIMLGHQPGLFSLYAEVCKEQVVGMVGFVLGEVAAACSLYPSVVVNNLVSRSPFPAPLPCGSLKAPPSAEKHLWRIPLRGGEVAFVLAHGKTMKDLKSRLYGTVRNMLHYDEYLQYRIDAANRLKFLICSDQWVQFCGEAPPRQSTVAPR